MSLSKRGKSQPEKPKDSSLREQRVEQRKEFTKACDDKGADKLGIARVTNRVYDELFDSRPEGDRDDWEAEDQKKITLGEHQAGNRVRELPDRSDRSQSQANDRVVDAAGDGAKSARDMIEDQTDNGNWFSRLFG